MDLCRHNLFAKDVGDYKICFDNKFSYVSAKTIYFELINENEEELDYDDLANIFQEIVLKKIAHVQLSSYQIDVFCYKCKKNHFLKICICIMYERRDMKILYVNTSQLLLISLYLYVIKLYWFMHMEKKK